MLNKLKRLITGERIEDLSYDEETPLEVFLEDINRRTREDEELTELEFFDESGKRIQHWKKYR